MRVCVLLVLLKLIYSNYCNELSLTGQCIYKYLPCLNTINCLHIYICTDLQLALRSFLCSSHWRNSAIVKCCGAWIHHNLPFGNELLQYRDWDWLAKMKILPAQIQITSLPNYCGRLVKVRTILINASCWPTHSVTAWIPFINLYQHLLRDILLLCYIVTC